MTDAVSVIGLGKLGLSFAACFAERGLKVVAVDRDGGKVARLGDGTFRSVEPGLVAMLKRNRQRLLYTEDAGDALAHSDVTFAILPTPSTSRGEFSSRYITGCFDELAEIFRRKRGYHLFVVLSTLAPGESSRLVERFARVSGREGGKGFGYCYNPEFVALGRVIGDFLNPDMVLVGEEDRKAGGILAGIYRRVCLNDPTVVRMSPLNAEIAKIALNCFLTVKISFANMIGALGEDIPGADAQVILEAVGRDRRIGSSYLRPGLGYGGPCFPRDNGALLELAARAGTPVELAEATGKINDALPRRLLKRIRGAVPKGGTVAVLGLSFKEDTEVVVASQAVDIAGALARSGRRVRVYDPAAMDSARQLLPGGVEWCETARECLDSSDLCLIATPWKEFRSLPSRFLAEKMAGGIIFDIWGILANRRIRGVRYWTAGRASSPASP
jgi:UDPglucose 6-dehydrogenase